MEKDSMAGPAVQPKLLPFFTTALKTYQLSSKAFAVLCSVPSAIHGDLAPPSPPTPSPRSLLVLDSSFNPPTVAHQRMVLTALSNHKYTESSRILLLLAINNADKAPKPAAFPQRLAMMYILAEDLLSRAGKLGSRCSGVDIGVTTQPYFHNKSAAVQESGFYHNSETSEHRTEQVYLTGFDTLIRIFNSKYYSGEAMTSVLDPFFAHSSLRVTMRTDADWGGAKEQEAYLDDLGHGGRLDDMGGRKEWVDKIEMTTGRDKGEDVVSSTKVRDAVQKQNWDRLGSLTSPAIAEWVREHGLYPNDEKTR
ncbi:nicotinamide-nucleotide adenylyltransferase [Microdochium nivale]|nr:nicotinamide-nucleotide adenylyltransferase [Microdochium nivale]